MLKKRYEAVIFDLDGTLLNTLEDLQASVNYAMKCHNMPEHSLEEIRCFVGNGIEKLIERAVVENTEESVRKAVLADFKVHYAIHCNDKTGLYPGISALLAKLKAQGFQMAIVSNKLQTGVDALYDKYFKEYLSVAIGAREGIYKKPAPDTVFEALRILNIPKEQAVYVGDSEVDVATGTAAGTKTVSVAWGFRTEDQLRAAGASLIIRSPEELLGLI